jgi:RNA polymerase sigma factor (sigma-70 family)
MLKIMAKNLQFIEQNIGLAHPINQQGNSKEIQSHMENEQHSLAARLAAGEHAAATELVDRNYQQIYLFMRRLGHSRQVSEDLTQETFLKAWRHIGQLRDGTALSSWLYRIGSNVSKLYWRKHKSRETSYTETLDQPDSGITERHKAEYYEQLSRLKIAVERLPFKLRQAIVLHYMQHLSIAKAAEVTCIRQGTFKSRLNRALKILRKHVSE